MVQDIITVLWQDWLILRERMGSFILARMVTPILYLIAFGWGMGRNIHMTQGSYLDFIVPGILGLNSMNISFGSIGASLHSSRVYYKTLEEFLVAPISPLSFVTGKVLSGTMRGMISSLIIIVVAFLFGARFQVNGLLLLALTINCAIFAALGFTVAMLINSHEDMGNFNTYVLLPMSFLCGTFFSTDKLPAVVRWLLEILPLTHTSHNLRSISSGGAGSGLSWLILLLYIAGLFALNTWIMKKVRE